MGGCDGESVHNGDDGVKRGVVGEEDRGEGRKEVFREQRTRTLCGRGLVVGGEEWRRGAGVGHVIY